jgi:hypothetical protein
LANDRCHGLLWTADSAIKVISLVPSAGSPACRPTVTVCSSRMGGGCRHASVGRSIRLPCADDWTISNSRTCSKKKIIGAAKDLTRRGGGRRGVVRSLCNSPASRRALSLGPALKNSLCPRTESDHSPIDEVRICDEQCSRSHDGVPSDAPANIILVRSPNSHSARERRDREDQRAQKHPGRPDRQVTDAIDDCRESTTGPVPPWPLSSTLLSAATTARGVPPAVGVSHESWKVAFAHLRVPSLPRNVIPVVTPLRRSHPSLHPVTPLSLETVRFCM